MSRILLMGVLLCGAEFAARAVGQTPIGQACWLTYRIPESSTDPEGLVKWVVEVQLRAAALDAQDGAVGWEVVQLRVMEFEDGQLLGEWETVPTVSSPDGLWWTAQDAEGRPVRGVLENPLMVQGVAPPSRSVSQDLEYAIVGMLPEEHTLSTTLIMLGRWFCLQNGCEESSDDVWLDVSLTGPSISY